MWGRCCFDTTNDYDHYYREPDEPRFALDPDAIGCGDAFGAFDEHAAFEAGSGPDEGDKVRCVHAAPAGLG